MYQLLRLTPFVLVLLVPSGFLTQVGASTTAHPDQYIVDQLSSFSSQYLARVAGRDMGLPPNRNGHDEFAAQWTREALANLHGVPVGVYRQPFPTPGFPGLPAKRPGVNVIVIVPGSIHPERAIVVGTHYDGEPTSQGSAYDDTSGCAILLALTRVLGDEWRVHGLPSLTVEFVLFDAEEQGLVGSGAYTFAYRHGALMPHPIIMLNEEQSGIGYPARPFGLLSRAPMPSYATTDGATPQGILKLYGKIIGPKKSALQLLLRRLDRARTTAFSTLNAQFSGLAYRGGNASAFTAADEHYLEVGPVPACCSDDAPFEALGLPTATFSGDYTYYQRHAAPWAYPFDQPQDTFAAMACDTGGSPQPTAALRAALEIPLFLSQRIVDDYAPPAAGKGAAIFSTQAAAGGGTQFQVVGPEDARWDFGDGKRGVGDVVTHSYLHPGRYTVTASSGALHQTQRITVHTTAAAFAGGMTHVHPPPVIPWHPAELQGIAGCP